MQKKGYRHNGLTGSKTQKLKEEKIFQVKISFKVKVT